MKELIIRGLNKIIRLLSAEGKVNKKVETPESIQAKRVVQWFKDEGDKTHRLNYDLSAESLVFDLGGYEGQWASDIYSMYNCSVWIFEPYLPFAKKIESRFSRNAKVKLFSFGLGPRTERVGFSILDNSSSIFQAGSQTDEIELVSVVDFLRTNNVHEVDLIKINIEGAEYELLECLLDTGLIKLFKNIQVQFHDFVIDNAKERMQNIHNRLSNTHQLTYHYEFVWDNWELKS